MIMFAGLPFMWNVPEESQAVQPAKSTVNYYNILGLIIQMIRVRLKRNRVAWAGIYSINR